MRASWCCGYLSLGVSGCIEAFGPLWRCVSSGKTPIADLWKSVWISLSKWGGKLISTDLPKSAQVSDTSANSQQASYLVDTYFGSLFTDALQIELHIAISGN